MSDAREQSESCPVNLPSSVASYTDEYLAEIAEYLGERGVVEDGDRVHHLKLEVKAGEAVEVLEVDDDAE